MTVKILPRRAKDTSPEPTDSRNDVSAVLLLPSEVAGRLRVTEKALEHWRRRGIGPRFIRLGRNCVRYRAEDVFQFALGRISP